jgi:hypothetical protein
MRAQGHPEPEPRRIFQKVFVPADGVKAANCSERRLRYVALFWATLRTRQCFRLFAYMAMPDAKHNRGEKLNAEKRRVARGNLKGRPRICNRRQNF